MLILLVIFKKEVFDPLDLRYFYFNGHYRKQLNFTWKSMIFAHNSYEKLKTIVHEWSKKNSSKPTTKEIEGIEKYSVQFNDALSNDLFTPGVIATVWEMAHSDLPNYVKYKLIKNWDKILGLDLIQISKGL